MSTGWQIVPIGKILKRVERFENKDELQEYHFAGTYSFARGIFAGEIKEGSGFRLDKIQRIHKGDFIYCKIMAWEGAFGIATEQVDDCVMSGAFVVYEIDKSRVEPKFLEYYFKQDPVWKSIGSQSIGTNVRRRSLHPDRFEKALFPLPPLDEQRRIVARIEALAGRVSQAQRFRIQAEVDINGMLLGAFSKITENAKYLPLSLVAPLIRRPVNVNISQDYPELGIRSFGKGTFHKPPLNGSAVGTKRLFEIKPGDLVFNNVFAWEGAVAVAKPVDEGRVGSHRFITCVPRDRIVTSKYLCFYFLTKEGLEKLGSASPGGAGRNRTLGLEALGRIEVPLPDYREQLWFDELLNQVDALRRLQAESLQELDALLPSILDKAFKGELVGDPGTIDMEEKNGSQYF